MASKPKYNPEDVERWVTVRGARIPIMKDGSFGVGETASGDKVVVKQDDLVDKKKIERKSLEDKYKQEYNDVWADDFARTYLRSDTDEELNETERNLQRDLSAGQMSVRAKYETMGMIQAINIERQRRQEKAKTTSRNARYDTSKTSQGKVAEAYKNVEIAKQAWRDAEQNKLAISKRLRNEYLKKNYGATYSQMEKKGTYTNKVHQEVGKYVMSVPEFKKAHAAEKEAMNKHVSTTAILKQEYEKYRKLGGVQNADWYRASREWDDRD